MSDRPVPNGGRAVKPSAFDWADVMFFAGISFVVGVMLAMMLSVSCSKSRMLETIQPEPMRVMCECTCP